MLAGLFPAPVASAPSFERSIFTHCLSRSCDGTPAPPKRSPIFMYITPSTIRASISPPPGRPSAPRSIVSRLAPDRKSTTPSIGTVRVFEPTESVSFPSIRAEPASAAASGDPATSASVETLAAFEAVWAVLPQAPSASTSTTPAMSERRMVTPPWRPTDVRPPGPGA